MRVGFTGAQGTGKTTLLKAAANSSLGFHVVPSTARAALAAGYKVNRDADPLSQLITTVSRAVTEDTIFNATGRTVSDRTPVDSLAYTSYQMGRVWEREYDMNSYYWQVSYGLVYNHMKKYDHVFYFPPYWEPKMDGVRDGDTEYQQDIDNSIQVILGLMEIPFVTMPKATTEERLAFLTKAVN